MTDEEAMQEEARLKDLLCFARERLAAANDEKDLAQNAVDDIEQQLEQFQ